MSLGNVKILDPGAFGSIGSQPFRVNSGTTASINAGEPVTKALGSAFVVSAATNTPQVGTDYMAGLAMTSSNETASAVGTVQVMPFVPGVVYMCAANNSALVDTQAEYNALVGDRVLFDKTNGVYTVLLTDGAGNGLIVAPLDVAKYPGMVAFQVRSAANFFA